MKYVLLALAALLAAATAAAQGDPAAGKWKSEAERCQECHGADGNSAEAKFPRLAGQHAAYLAKQLRNFQSGERKHETMSNMAAGIGAADVEDIAAYFAGNRPMPGGGGRDNPLGRQLFAAGDPGRNIPPCANCHGADGRGASTYPAIGGQHKFYLRAQLLDWRLGARTNSPGGVMNRVTNVLSDAEIDALANFISGL